MIENITALPSVLTPIASSIGSMMGLVRLLVGGVFGLYVIVFLWRLWDSHRNRTVLRNIQKEINNIKLSIKRLELREKQEYKDKLNELILKTDSETSKKKKAL